MCLWIYVHLSVFVYLRPPRVCLDAQQCRRAGTRVSARPTPISPGHYSLCRMRLTTPATEAEDEHFKTAMTIMVMIKDGWRRRMSPPASPGAGGASESHLRRSSALQPSPSAPRAHSVHSAEMWYFSSWSACFHRGMNYAHYKAQATASAAQPWADVCPTPPPKYIRSKCHFHPKSYPPTAHSTSPL